MILLDDISAKKDISDLSLGKCTVVCTLQIKNVVVNGSTVTIETRGARGEFLHFSLNNSTWQTANTFILTPGDYRIFVRDGLGCKVMTEVSVIDDSLPAPFFGTALYGVANYGLI